MRTYKKIPVPATEREVLDELKCDICKDVAKHHKWGKGNYSTNEVKIEWINGMSYPDDCWGNIVSYDMCPTCFQNKLMPWLESQGATPTKTEY